MLLRRFEPVSYTHLDVYKRQIYAGVQKNVGPAGMVIVIIREDLIREDLDPKMPIYMRYDTHAKNGSMYNTPNCWAIYCCGKVFKYLKSIGGLEEMHKRNIAKAKVIYDFLDSSKMFHGTVEPEFRALMNLSLIHSCSTRSGKR